jgi:hypothetical protein
MEYDEHQTTPVGPTLGSSVLVVYGKRQACPIWAGRQAGRETRTPTKHRCLPTDPHTDRQTPREGEEMRTHKSTKQPCPVVQYITRTR